MDVGHSSARNSQAATLAAASGNLLLFTLTDTHTHAWLKESSLVTRALKFTVNDKCLDISTVKIYNSKYSLLILSFKRVNGPEGSVTNLSKSPSMSFMQQKRWGKMQLKFQNITCLRWKSFYNHSAARTLMCHSSFWILL